MSVSKFLSQYTLVSFNVVFVPNSLLSTSISVFMLLNRIGSIGACFFATFSTLSKLPLVVVDVAVDSVACDCEVMRRFRRRRFEESVSCKYESN